MSLSDKWCQVKTAFLLDVHSALTDACADDTIFDYDWKDILPKGWEMKNTDISGAAGFVLIFEIEHVPSEAEFLRVQQIIENSY